MGQRTVARRLLDGLSHGKVSSVTLPGFPELWAILSKRRLEKGGKALKTPPSPGQRVL